MLDKKRSKFLDTLLGLKSYPPREALTTRVQSPMTMVEGSFSRDYKGITLWKLFVPHHRLVFRYQSVSRSILDVIEPEIRYPKPYTPRSGKSCPEKIPLGGWCSTASQIAPKKRFWYCRTIGMVPNRCKYLF